MGLGYLHVQPTTAVRLAKSSACCSGAMDYGRQATYGRSDTKPLVLFALR